MHVGDVRIHIGKGGQLRVVGHEESVGGEAAGGRHGEALGDGEREGDPVDVGGAAAQLVDDDQGTRSEILQDVGARETVERGRKVREEGKMRIDYMMIDKIAAIINEQWQKQNEPDSHVTFIYQPTSPSSQCGRSIGCVPCRRWCRCGRAGGRAGGWWRAALAQNTLSAPVPR